MRLKGTYSLRSVAAAQHNWNFLSDPIKKGNKETGDPQVSGLESEKKIWRELKQISVCAFR